MSEVELATALNQQRSGPGYLTTGQAARLLGIAKGTLLRAVRLGEIRVARKMPGGAFRFDPADVDAYARHLASRSPQWPAATAGMESQSLHAAPLPGAGPAPLQRTLPATTGRQRSTAEQIQATDEPATYATTRLAGDLDRLISDVLALLADSLHVGLSFFAQVEGATWRLVGVHDRMGLGLVPGAEIPLWNVCGAIVGGAASVLIADDIHVDERFAVLADASKRGLGSYTGVSLYRLDGRRYGALCTLHPYARAVPDGEIALLRVAGRIIMQAVEVIEALQLSEARFRVLAENANDLVSVVDKNAVLVYASPSYKSILGYNHGELVGTSFFDLLHPDDRAAVRTSWGVRSGEGERTTFGTIRLRHIDGSWLAVDTVAWAALGDQIVIDGRSI